MIFHDGGRFLKYIEVQKILQSLDSYFRDRMQFIIGNLAITLSDFQIYLNKIIPKNTSKCLMSKKNKSIQIWAWDCAYYVILAFLKFWDRWAGFFFLEQRYLCLSSLHCPLFFKWQILRSCAGFDNLSCSFATGFF